LCILYALCGKINPKAGVARNPKTIGIEEKFVAEAECLTRHAHTFSAEKDAIFRKFRKFASVVRRLPGNTVGSNSNRKLLL